MADTDLAEVEQYEAHGAPTGDGPPDQRPDPVARLVSKRWDEGSQELMRHRRDYWQNLAFFFNEQWVWWDRQRRRLDSLPQSWSPLGPGRARITVNLIEPNLMSLLARLMHSPLAFEVPPSDSADDVVAAARLAESVLESAQYEQDWEAVRYDALFAAFMGAASAVAVDWDGSAGESLEIDHATGRVVGTGEVCLQALNITEFCLEPGVREWEQARWWIQALSMSPEQAKSRYNLSWTPQPDASTLLSPLQERLLRESGRATIGAKVLVLTMYERPNPEQRKGRVVTCINDRVVAQDGWPFPFDGLNLRVFRQRKVSGQWQGTTLMNAAVTVQFAYNHARSVIHEHMKLAGNARLMAPWGAFAEEDFTNDPSSILWYSPDAAGAQPNYLSPPPLPRWMLAEAQNLKDELSDIMHVHATSRGEATFDRASGQALALLAEKDDSPLALMAREQSQGWSEIGEKVLKLYEAKATESRTATVARPGGGVPTIVKWSGKMLKGQTRVRVPDDVTQPTSKAAMQAFVKDLWDRQIITDATMYARLTGVPERELTQVIDADVAKAQRENSRMALGYPELPEPFDDHAKHIAEHNRFRKSDAYAFADGDVQELVDDHVRFHENLAAKEAAGQAVSEQQVPGSSSLPQADEPPGSQVPPDHAEQAAAAAAEAAGGPGMGAPPGFPGGAPPSRPPLGGPSMPPAGPAPGVAPVQAAGPVGVPAGAPAGTMGAPAGGGVPPGVLLGPDGQPIIPAGGGLTLNDVDSALADLERQLAQIEAQQVPGPPGGFPVG